MKFEKLLANEKITTLCQKYVFRTLYQALQKNRKSSKSTILIRFNLPQVCPSVSPSPSSLLG